jgi:hypothetical protein
MVMVSKLSGVKLFEDRVVLRVGCREHDILWELEDNTFEGRQTRSVEVLYYLHDRGRIEAIQALIPVGECTLYKINALALPFRHLVQMEALFSQFQ